MCIEAILWRFDTIMCSSTHQLVYKLGKRLTDGSLRRHSWKLNSFSETFYSTYIAIRPSAMKSTQSIWDLPSQVKSFSSQVAVDEIYLNCRHENISSRDFNLWPATCFRITYSATSGVKNYPTLISGMEWDITEIPTATSPIFEVQQLNGTIANSARHNRKSEIQDGGRLTGFTYNSACRLDSNAISTATPTFSKSSESMGLLRILPDITGSRKSQMAAA